MKEVCECADTTLHRGCNWRYDEKTKKSSRLINKIIQLIK